MLGIVCNLPILYDMAAMADLTSTKLAEAGAMFHAASSKRVYAEVV